jgi:hypothetical protein
MSGNNSGKGENLAVETAHPAFSTLLADKPTS